MSVKVSTGAVNAMIGNIGLMGALQDGVIEIRSGAQPSNPDAPASGTLLGLVTKGGLPFVPGEPANGLTYEGPLNGAISKPAADEWKFTGLAAGVAGHARVRGNAPDNGASSTTLVRIDCSVGSAGSEITLSNVNVAVGVPGAITSFSIVMPTA